MPYDNHKYELVCLADDCVNNDRPECTKYDNKRVIITGRGLCTGYVKIGANTEEGNNEGR